VATALPEPLRVVVLDAAGTPLPGVAVTWSVTGGGGAITPNTDTTDSQGLAEAAWVLGDAAGVNHALASTSGTSPVEFLATGVPGPVVTVALSSTQVTVDLGRTVQLTAEARDEYGNVAVAEPFTWDSADPNVATVSQTGEITPVAKGTTTVTATTATGPSALASVMVPEPPLRYLASLRSIEIGSAVQLGPLGADSSYSYTLDREFNTITPENAMKFGPLRPARTSFDFDRADQLVEFAEAGGMSVHGHTLVWHNQLPGWLTGGSFSRSELLDILKQHILTVAGHYEGQVGSWDVVNEAVADDGVSLRSTIWLDIIGPEYLDSAFVWAARADPGARLYYNDYSGEGLGPKSNRIFELVSDLVARGIPIHGVGLQSHFQVDGAPPQPDVLANMQRIAGLGLEVWITELDVRIQGTPSETELETQAAVFRSMLRACLAVESCKAVTMWGFTDKYSWIPSFFPGWGSATIFDATFSPKPAYWAIHDELGGQ
jgi:endo-1,4-beta-xylanase